MNEIVKSETTDTYAVITESTNAQGKFYISISGEGNGYDDYANTIEEAREIAVNLIADWDGFETEPIDPAEDEYNRFMDAINADDTETLAEIADNAWEYTEPTAEIWGVFEQNSGCVFNPENPLCGCLVKEFPTRYEAEMWADEHQDNLTFINGAGGESRESDYIVVFMKDGEWQQS